MATYKELEKYYDHLKESYESKESDSYYFNNDRSHNAMVMKFMFDYSSIINMYCGELSVLRESFYGYINEDKDEIKKNVICSLKKFLDKEDAKLCIIVENFSKKIFEDLICKEVFINKLKEGKIHLFKLDRDFSFKKEINHFCYSDTNIVRFEVDKNQHNAICVFHNKKYLNSMENNFGTLYNIAQKVN